MTDPENRVVIISVSLEKLESSCFALQGDADDHSLYCLLSLPQSALHFHFSSTDSDDSSRILQQQEDATGDEGSNDGSTNPEAFPIIFSAVCMAITIAFTIFVAIRTMVKFRATRDRMRNLQSSTDRVSNDTERSTKDIANPKESVIDLQYSSWVGITSGADQDGKQPIREEDKLNDQMEKEEAEEEKKRNERVVLSWKDLSCSYLSKQNAETFVTLQGASGALRTRELTAIMGASGGGKSTLLDILSGRKNLGQLGGEMSILGNVVPIAEAGAVLRDVAAYVPQKETFFPTQTPEEAVAFFANLKLGRDRRGETHRLNSISKLLDLVGLPWATRTRPIGGSLAGGITIRGLSGGERKRLALACAVAMRPSILFLDEITSGLDSENAVNVIQLLKRLCDNTGVAAAVVIHQPSAKVFELFDQLILLSNGSCIYSDQTANIPKWYREELDCPLPASHLLADDLLLKSTHWSFSDDEAKNKETKSILLPSKAIESRVSAENDMGTTTLWTFSCIFFRNLENHYVRNLTNLAARFVIYAMTAVLLGLIFWQVGDNDADTVNNADAQILLGAGLFLAQSSILLPFSQISTFFFDKNVFAAENALGLYAPWMYALTQFLLEAWVLILSALAQASISTAMIALWNPVWSKVSSFFTMLSFFCIGGLVGNAIILFISMVSFSQDLAFLNGSSYVTLALAASGGFVPFEVMPSWLRWLQWISAVKYALQIFIQAAFSGTTVTLIEQMQLDTPDTISNNLLILLAMFLCFASLSIVFLSIQKERR